MLNVSDGKSSFGKIKRAMCVTHYSLSLCMCVCVCRNAAFSSVCTLTGMNTTEVLNNKAGLDGVKRVMKEMILTANAMGYDFDVESQMDAMIKGSATNVPNYKPSM